MAIVNAAILSAINTQVKKDWQDGFNAVKPNHQSFTMHIPSTSASNTYAWVNELAEIREWVGDRVINDLAVSKYSVENKVFELSHGVKKTDIEDDQLGMYSWIFKGHGEKFANFPGKKSWQILKDGFTHVCFDNQYYFDIDHPVYGNHDGTGAVTTTSNMQAGIDPLWILVDDSQLIKPVIWQERKKPKFTAMTKTDDESVFMKNEFRFGTDMRGNSGLSLWQLAFASKAPLTQANVQANRTAMKSFKRDGGEPLGVNPTLCLVGASNIDAAEALFLNEKLSDGTRNPLYKKCQIIECPWWE